jgi:tRNA1Val (adenine37-N6)-methyltransferase
MKPFAFKDFVVHQQNSPLKVSTDAILLGATVTIATHHKRVLDVGTGSGVIALLLASRFANIHLTAIDPHSGAILDAQQNFEQSKYSARLVAKKAYLKELVGVLTFDVLVSNPPYFIDSLAADLTEDQQAKHFTSAQYFDLLADMIACLKPEGQIWLILPMPIAQQTISFFQIHGFYCTYQVHFHANQEKRNKRWVLRFERQNKPLVIAELVLRNTNGTFHDDYRELASQYHDRVI